MLNRSNGLKRHKSKVAVELQRDDGSRLEGYLFAEDCERILDSLNAEDPFVPFESVEGEVLILNKTAIKQVKPFDRHRMEIVPLEAETATPPGALPSHLAF